MIEVNTLGIYGTECAIYGMRNPMNSWSKSDTEVQGENVSIGSNDLSLMKKLSGAGPVHGKFMRMIIVYADINAPLYWWKEFDTYKVGTVRNSCSTMHKIMSKPFNLEDFSYDHLDHEAISLLDTVIEYLNRQRRIYMNGNEFYLPNDKKVWYRVIQTLPSSYNQKATVMMNYEVLRNMYHYRKNHKLEEWRSFCSWVDTLPYAEDLITPEVQERFE